MHYRKVTDSNGNSYIETNFTDYALITNPLLNKGMAFTEAERNDFDLFGLIPPETTTLDEQRMRSYKAFKSKSSNLEKYIYLRDLQDSNETLFYSLLCANLVEMMPIIYTPVVGEGCQQFSHTYRRPRGLFLAYPYRERIEQILANWRFNQVEIIVVSDGERILGLGDQGAGGMGIPIGKLALYSACAGIDPAKTLPILLDTGTNNKGLLQDPLYVGWRHERIRGKEYDDFIATFVQAVKKRFPHVLLQWEDFAQQNANPILERYRDQLCTFNDDIQGTAAIATATLLAAVQVTGIPLRDQRIAILGAGSAGCGISNLLIYAMIEEGLTEKEASSRFYLIDRNGLLTADMPNLLPFQEKFVQPKDKIAHWDKENSNHITLMDVIKNVHPTVLVGVSGQANVFTEAIVREMTKYVDKPVIFPLSNPTNCSEATPMDLMTWTNGKAIIGTGSPFADIVKNGQPFRVDQTNNAYIFPGLGLGLTAVKANRITDKMFMVAAKALANCSPAKQNPNANLLPPLTDIQKVSFAVALAVAKEAIVSNLTTFVSVAEAEIAIKNKLWQPIYLPYKKLK